MMHSARRRKAVSAFAKEIAGDQKKLALLVTHPADVRYLCGFTGSSGALLLQGARATLFTDGRYATQADGEVSGVRVVIAERAVVAAALNAALEAGAEGCGFDVRSTTVYALEMMRAALPAKLRKTWLIPVNGLIAGLREVKDAEEQEQMRAAAELGCMLFHQILEYVHAGTTEMEIALALEYMARLEGAEGMSFETIVASGERSALPHGRATNSKLPRRGFVTLDFGVMLHGYCSDMTRTVHLGRARQGEREVYEAVHDAQEAALAVVKAGRTCGDVDEAARSVLRGAGLAERFTHSTGHGVGLEIHEGPRLGKGNAEELRAGMVVTIEPGVYLPGEFGVRIEDTVLVTASGYEMLTPSTKAWIEL